MENLEQWSSGQGAGFPIQGSHVQNHWVAPRLTQPFMLPRSINEYQEFFNPETLKYQFGVQQGQSYFMGRSCSLALVGHLSTDGVTIKISPGVDVLH